MRYLVETSERDRRTDPAGTGRIRLVKFAGRAGIHPTVAEVICRVKMRRRSHNSWDTTENAFV